jgi:hypothetical protein
MKNKILNEQARFILILFVMALIPYVISGKWDLLFFVSGIVIVCLGIGWVNRNKE